MYGVDIAVRRMDDLDKKALAHVREAVESGVVPTVLDLGCGAGGLSVQLAEAGARVVAVDVGDFDDTFDALKQEHDVSEGKLRYIHGDMREVQALVPGEKFDICCIQRALHYIPYTDAQQFLQSLRSVVNEKLYISVTGLDTAIGEKYSDADKGIEERFAPLDTDAMETFSIHEPLCLYTPDEFTTLLTDSGWKVEECWVSAFGNIKAVCVK